jgi:Mg2+/Co2+ transporter CorB
MSNRNQFAFIVDEGGDQRWIIVTPDIAEGLMYRITGASSVGEEDWLERCLSKAFTQEVKI